MWDHLDNREKLDCRLTKTFFNHHYTAFPVWENQKKVTSAKEISLSPPSLHSPLPPICWIKNIDHKLWPIYFNTFWCCFDQMHFSLLLLWFKICRVWKNRKIKQWKRWGIPSKIFVQKPVFQAWDLPISIIAVVSSCRVFTI